MHGKRAFRNGNNIKRYKVTEITHKHTDMTETVNPVVDGQNVATVSGSATAQPGTAGLETQNPGKPTTVSAASSATGGIASGNFIESDVDRDLFLFHKDETPLMQLMLSAKTVKVDSPVVEHFMIDEPRSEFKTNAAVTKSGNATFQLPTDAKDQRLCAEYGTILVKGVNGYEEDGQTETPGKDLMLFVVGRNDAGAPIVLAANGPKANKTDEYCTTPAIPAGSQCIILAPALYETQKEVQPDLITPKPTEIYLQKRGMNQIVSDYFDSQKKHIPFSKALIAEQAISNFKVKGNRTLWAGRKAKIVVNTKKLGPQLDYMTEGIRWQFKREMQQTGKWTYEKFIALAKMFFTGEDVPKTALLLAGKNLLESVQCIDFSKHPEVKISVATNYLGWDVTRIHTVFGDIDIKREPTLDYLGYSNSGALIGENRLVHYVYSTEHSFNEDVEGEEAKRSGIIVWDGLALKGTCHIWIDGEGNPTTNGATGFVMWDSDVAPTGDDLVNGRVYYLLQDCPGINKLAQNGQMWKYTAGSGEASTGTWEEFKGDYYAG